jgi:hypothetical protein
MGIKIIKTGATLTFDFYVYGQKQADEQTTYSKASHLLNISTSFG